AADALAAGAAEGKRGVDGSFDLDQGIEHHGTAGFEVKLEAVDARLAADLGIETVDLEPAQLPRTGTGRRLVDPSRHDARVLRQCEFSHARSAFLNKSWLWAG